MKLSIETIKSEENISILNKKENLFEASFKVTGRIFQSSFDTGSKIYKDDEIHLICTLKTKEISDALKMLMEEKEC